MNPTEVRLPGRTVVTIHNTGNAAASFNVGGRDLQQFVRFRGEREGIALQPNQTANVELVMEMRETNFFGEEDAYPFEVEVSAGPSVRQVLPGEDGTRANVVPAGRPGVMGAEMGTPLSLSLIHI